MYYYCGFGLNIASEIEFPELLSFEFTGGPDVNITIGITPKTLTGADVTHKVGVSISPNQYLLKLLNIANYYATNGNSIVIEPLQGGDEKSIRLFLLNSVMAAVLHQRNAVVLHASAFNYQDGVVLLCGPTNVGKSILLAKMQQKGYQIFTDSCCLVQYNDLGFCEVIPSYPMINLWGDSFDHLNLPKPADNNKLRPQLPKYGISYHQTFNTQPKPVKHIFILAKSQTNTQNTLAKLSPVEAFSNVHNNIFHRLQIYPMKKQTANFSTLSKLTSHTPTYLICSGNADQFLEEVCDKIEMTLQTKE
jgi:hypothetical protein